MSDLRRRYFEKKNIAPVIAAACGFFVLGGLVSYMIFGRSSAAPVSATTAITTGPLRLGREGLINPVLAYTTPKSTMRLAPLEKSIQSEIYSITQAGTASDVGVYFQDLDAGRWTGVNEEHQFSPASLLKVPVMIAYLKSAEADPNTLDRKMTFDGSFDDNAIENIKPLKSIQAGKSYSIDDLIKYMIEYSDNNAAHILFDDLGIDKLKQVFDDLKVPFPMSQSDYLSPEKYSFFFRVLYNSTYLSPLMAQKALGLLAYADFPQGISAGVPENITTAQKFGEHTFPGGTQELHDCGIIYHPTHPYFLCIMTKGGDLAKLTDVIRKMSVLIYDQVDKNFPN